MSPEQAEGRLERVGPLSDVYSLGATLYCLLTGKPPIDERKILCRGSFGVVQRSDFRSPRQLDPTIDPALEAVCQKAMAFDRIDRRFELPAPALAEDVERFMADEPVSAWREPFGRRIWRW